MRGVKSPPGSVRAERAALTRRQIEAAARSRFRSDGYAATTLRDIADAAGVAVQTVYAVYGSKANILRALRLAVVGDAEADEAWGAALTAPDVETVLRRFARSIRLRWEHGADIVAINSDAARSDPDVRAEVGVAVSIRRTGIGELARSLVALDRRLGSANEVTAVLEALTVPDAYAVLVEGHGWSPDRYEAWLAATMIATLSAAG